MRTVASTKVSSRATTVTQTGQGYLGAATVTIEPSLLEALPRPENDVTGFPKSGVLIESVEAHSPAALAGLHGQEGGPYKDFGGDAITAADGISITSSSELGEIVASLKPGQVIPLVVARSFEEPQQDSEETRFAYETPTAVSVRLGLRPGTVPRVRALGEDCGSTEVEPGRYLHLFASMSVGCDAAAATMRQYASRPERECGGNMCTIRLAGGWVCSSPPSATSEATGIVNECSSGGEKVVALPATQQGPSVTQSASAEASMPAACGQPPYLQHPSRFAFSCDGNTIFTTVHWQHWGESSATGDGTLSMLSDGCIPDCATAPRNQYAARIVASDIIFCGTRRIYSTLTAYLAEPDSQGHRVLSAPRVTSCD